MSEWVSKASDGFHEKREWSHLQGEALLLGEAGLDLATLRRRGHKKRKLTALPIVDDAHGHTIEIRLTALKEPARPVGNL